MAPSSSMFDVRCQLFGPYSIFWMLFVGFLLNIRYFIRTSNLEPRLRLDYVRGKLLLQFPLNIPFNIPEDKPAINSGFCINIKHKPLFYKQRTYAFQYQVLLRTIILI